MESQANYASTVCRRFASNILVGEFRPREVEEGVEKPVAERSQNGSRGGRRARGGLEKVDFFRLFSMVAKCHEMMGDDVKSVWEGCLGCRTASKRDLWCVSGVLSGCWGRSVAGLLVRCGGSAVEKIDGICNDQELSKIVPGEKSTP